MTDTSDAREFKALCKKAAASSLVDSELYAKYDVKRGLRDISGAGVLAGLTQIGEVQGRTEIKGSTVPGPGRLFYRGINIDELVNGFFSKKKTGFEESAYLLLFGE